jgi:hypothetical protein
VAVRITEAHRTGGTVGGASARWEVRVLTTRLRGAHLAAFGRWEEMTCKTAAGGAQGGTREGSRVCRAAAGAAGTHPRTALGVLVALGPVPRAVRLAHGVGRSGGGRSQRGPQQAGEQPSSVGSPADMLYDPVKPLGLHGSHLPACARLLRRWRLGQRGAVAIVNGEMVSLMDPLYTRQSPPGGCGDCNTVLTERRNASSSEVRS